MTTFCLLYESGQSANLLISDVRRPHANVNAATSCFSNFTMQILDSIYDFQSYRSVLNEVNRNHFIIIISPVSCICLMKLFRI